MKKMPQEVTCTPGLFRQGVPCWLNPLQEGKTAATTFSHVSMSTLSNAISILISTVCPGSSGQVQTLCPTLLGLATFPSTHFVILGFLDRAYHVGLIRSKKARQQPQHLVMSQCLLSCCAVGFSIKLRSMSFCISD
jgi:hypothetical protein